MAILNPKFAQLQSRLPGLFRFRLSKVPIIVLTCIILFGLFQYLSDPESFDLLDTLGMGEDEEYYDPHLYDFHKYPGAARAGAHHEHDSHDDESRPKQVGPGMDEIGEHFNQNGELNYTSIDGLARGWKLEGRTQKNIGKRLTHPIQTLMAENKQKWEDLLKRQSSTLKQAVQEYLRRYGRLPPKGFDQWWQYCQDNDVKIVDDYDQINHDIEPFLALSPEMFNERVSALTTAPFTFHISVGPDATHELTGQRATATRAKQLFNLVTALGSVLPKDINIHVSDHDLGSWILGEDQRSLAKTRIDSVMQPDGTGLNKIKYLGGAELKRLENKNRNDHRGWFSACDEDSPARGHDRVMENRLREIDGLDPLPEPATPAFVQDVRPGFDWCQNPGTQKLHGTMSFDFPRDTTMRPIFVLSKHQRNNEFLFPPMEAYENATDPEAIKKYKPWAEKTINKVFWRGTSTGDSYSKRKSDPNYDWRKQHRPRLHLMAQAEEGSKDIWLRRGREWVPEDWSIKRLNEHYLDISLTGKPHQCDQADGTCDEMAAEIKFADRIAPEQAAQYKYVLDVDGNGWSSRLHRLMTSGSVVIKHTIFPEWHHDWLTPWVHFIPMQIDYSDLYDISAFFIGSPDGRVKGHDAHAQQIAEQGRKFALEHWRWEDMQAYMYRLLLEYTRLMAEDRDAWSFGSEYIQSAEPATEV